MQVNAYPYDGAADRPMPPVPRGWTEVGPQNERARAIASMLGDLPCYHYVDADDDCGGCYRFFAYETPLGTAVSAVQAPSVASAASDASNAGASSPEPVPQPSAECPGWAPDTTNPRAARIAQTIAYHDSPTPWTDQGAYVTTIDGAVWCFVMWWENGLKAVAAYRCLTNATSSSTLGQEVLGLTNAQLQNDAIALLDNLQSNGCTNGFDASVQTFQQSYTDAGGTLPNDSTGASGIDGLYGDNTQAALQAVISANPSNSSLAGKTAPAGCVAPANSGGTTPTPAAPATPATPMTTVTQASAAGSSSAAPAIVAGVLTVGAIVVAAMSAKHPIGFVRHH